MTFKVNILRFNKIKYSAAEFFYVDVYCCGFCAENFITGNLNLCLFSVGCIPCLKQEVLTLEVALFRLMSH